MSRRRRTDNTMSRRRRTDNTMSRRRRQHNVQKKKDRQHNVQKKKDRQHNAKEELIKSQKQNERLTALVGKVTVEKKWLAKKLKSLGLSNCKQLVELKLSSLHMPCSLLSVNQQCQLLGVACITNCNTPIFHTTLK